MDIIGILFFPALIIIAVIIRFTIDIKEEWQQKKITKSARKNMANHTFLEKRKYSDGWAVVKLENERFAYVNNDGQYLNDEIYTVADSFIDGTAIVKNEKGYALVDQFGNYVIPSHTRIERKWNGIFLCTINRDFNGKDTYHIIRKDGTYIYSEPILSIEEIKDNYIKFKSKDGIGEVDLTGHMISRPYKYKVKIGGDFLLVQKDSTNCWGVDKNNSDKIIIPCEYGSIIFIEKYSRFILYPKVGNPFIVDSDNNIIVSQEEYQRIDLIDRQYIQVENNNNKKGIIDGNGKILVQPIYSTIWPTSRGFMVTDNNKCGKVRKDGFAKLNYTIEKIITNPKSYYYIQCSSGYDIGFYDFLSPKPRCLIVSYDGLYGVIDLNGYAILPFLYNSIKYCDEHNSCRFIVEKGGLLGLADSNGRITIPIKYKELSEHRQDEKLFFKAKDSSGHIVFLNSDGIKYDPNSEENKEKYLLFFDTETTGVPTNYNAPSSEIDNWPRLVQLSRILISEKKSVISRGDFIIKPEGFIIPLDSIGIHGITNERANNEGTNIKLVIDLFLDAVSKAKCIIGHNINFDMKVLGAELYRLNKKDVLSSMKSICTMKESIDFCAIPSAHGYKYPKLQELYYKLFGKNYADEHNSSADTQATVDCFFELVKKNVITDPVIRINYKGMESSSNRTYNNGVHVENMRYFSIYELEKIIKAEVVRGLDYNSCCFHYRNKYPYWNGKNKNLYYTPMSDDSTIEVGDEVDLNNAQIVTLSEEGKNRIERIRILNSSSVENSDIYVVKNVRFFTSEEQNRIHRAFVVIGLNGENTCAFIMKNGDLHFTPMSEYSTLEVGDEVDLSKAVILTLYQQESEIEIEVIRD